jgi:hypothetical protein
MANNTPKKGKFSNILCNIFSGDVCYWHCLFSAKSRISISWSAMLLLVLLVQKSLEGNPRVRWRLDHLSCYHMYTVASIETRQEFWIVPIQRDIFLQNNPLISIKYLTYQIFGLFDQTKGPQGTLFEWKYSKSQISISRSFQCHLTVNSGSFQSQK